MGIRRARPEDWKNIRLLLDQLEYPGSEHHLQEKLNRMIKNPDEVLLVYEEEDTGTGKEFSADLPDRTGSGAILGFTSLHFIPQIALPGDFARISYFAVDEQARSKGIGREMEEYCTGLARERGCYLIEVHCHTRREAAHRFYFRQGYTESPKYLVKRL
jgi:GNAT superfamily N-acetyltransferase